MGAKANPIFNTFYADDEVETWDALKKFLFIYLFTGEYLTTSGIYKITKKRIKDATAIDSIPLIDHYLGIRKLTKENYRRALYALADRWTEEFDLESQYGFRNAPYDESQSVIFVKRRLAFILGGRADWLLESINSDKKLLQNRPRAFWDEFEKYHAEKLAELRAKAIELQEKYGKRVKKKEPDAVPETKERPAPQATSKTEEMKTKKQTEDAEFQKKIDEGLQYFHSGLKDEDDYQHIATAFLHCITSLKTGNPCSLKTQWDMIERLLKEDTPLVISRACYLFNKAVDEDKAKRFPYLVAIIPSAWVWFKKNFPEKVDPLFDEESGIEKLMKEKREART